MTSPHAPDSEVVAAMATTAIHDNQAQIDLTAVENTEDAASTIARQEIQDAIMSEENTDTEPPGGNAEEEHIREETVNWTEEATVPNGIDPIQDSQPEHPPVLTMDALDALLAYAQPSPHGFAAPQIPAAGLPFLQAAINASVEHDPFMDPIPYNREMDDPGLSAYAKLIFEDGFFFMTTYSLVLGRDTAAARAAIRREEAEERRRLDEELAAREPKTPVQPRREESRYSKSVVSESGGIFREGDDSDSDDRERRRKRRKTSKKSRSTGSSSRHISRRSSLVQPNEPIVYQPQVVSRRSAPETAGAVPVDPASLRPSPYDCPTIGIHPPASTPASAYKGISRQHVKIAYNTTKDFFELEIMGRNGAFVDGEFHHHNNVVPLKSGSELQIGGVVVRFMLPDVVIGETGPGQRQRYDEDPRSYSEGGKEMSFDFEDDPRAGMLYETSEGSASEDEGAGNEELEDEEEEEEEEQEEEEEEEEEDDGENDEEVDENENDLESRDHSKMLGGQGKAGEDEGPDEESRPDPTFNNQKKRGPGRPPKNGIMSKREQQLAKKEALAQEKAKRTVPQAPIPGKNKVGRPRKHPRPDTPPIKTEKRKYTKRKPKEPKDPKHEGSGGEDQPAKEKKEKKPPKPPRSPSPQFNEADLTPEQLAKPQANYVTLIHEALSNSETGQMSLPQIYRAIQRKYPFFVLKCSTNGWQSSVRHNLSQHHAFKKVERDGKGWMWAIVDGVSIEKEKKRRATPPIQLPPGHMYHQPIYQAGQQPHMMHPYGPGMMGPPPGYPMNHQLPPNMRPGQPPPYMGPPPQTNGHLPPPGSHPGMNGLPPPGFGPTMPLQLATSHGATLYSSPYAPKPPPSTPSQPSEQRAPTGNPPPTQGPPPPAAPRQQPTPPQNPQQTAQQNHPPSNENTIRAIELFKARMIASLTGDTSNVEAIVDSAINRVLGRTGQSAVPGDSQEAKIVTAVENMVNQINAKPGNENQLSPQNQPNQTDVAAPEPGKGHIAGKPARSVMRPTFTGQSQSRSNIPRPPMNTPSIKRTNSSSPANAPPRLSVPSSASPAPTPSSGNGANTAKLLATENGQLAGQKRAHDDADDMREFKRLSTSGPPQVKT